MYSKVPHPAIVLTVSLFNAGVITTPGPTVCFAFIISRPGESLLINQVAVCRVLIFVHVITSVALKILNLSNI